MRAIIILASFLVHGLGPASILPFAFFPVIFSQSYLSKVRSRLLLSLYYSAYYIPKLVSSDSSDSLVDLPAVSTSVGKNALVQFNLKCGLDSCATGVDTFYTCYIFSRNTFIHISIDILK